MYMICSVSLLNSFPNIAQGRNTHSKGVLVMASPRFRLVIYAWHLNFCISWIMLLQVWVARAVTRLSSKATTISPRPILSSLSTQTTPCQLDSAMSHRTRHFLSDTSLKRPCCNPRFESCPAPLQHNPSPVAYYPEQLRHLYRATLQLCYTLFQTTRMPWVCQLHGCISPPGIPIHEIFHLDTTGARRLVGVPDTPTGSLRGLIVKHYYITLSRCV